MSGKVDMVAGRSCGHPILPFAVFDCIAICVWWMWLSSPPQENKDINWPVLKTIHALIPSHYFHDKLREPPAVFCAVL